MSSPVLCLPYVWALPSTRSAPSDLASNLAGAAHLPPHMSFHPVHPMCSYYRWAWAQTAVDMTVFGAHEMREKFSEGPQRERLQQVYEKARVWGGHHPCLLLSERFALSASPAAPSRLLRDPFQFVLAYAANRERWCVCVPWRRAGPRCEEQAAGGGVGQGQDVVRDRAGAFSIVAAAQRSPTASRRDLRRIVVFRTASACLRRRILKWLIDSSFAQQDKYKDAAISIRKPVGNTSSDGRGESCTHRLGGSAMR